MNFLSGLERLERAAFVFFSLFLLLQCLSIAAANIALGIAVFFLVLQLLQSKGSTDKQALCEAWAQNKNLFILLVVFWATILLSALGSNEPLRALKIFLGQFIYRTAPLFVILFFFAKRKYVSFFLLLTILSCIIDVIGGILVHGDSLRLKGLYGHPMTLAGFLIITLPILYAFLLDWKQKRQTLVVTIVLFLIAFVGLLLNETRGAWLALAITLPLITLLYDCSIKKVIFLIAFAIGTSLVFLNSPQLQNRAESITSTTLQSNTERVLMWQSAYEMFKDHPILGVGLGQYAPKYLNEYKSPQAKERQNHSHNNFLQMLAENGIVGFLGFVLLFGYLLLSSFRNSVRKLSPYHVLIFGCTLAFILQGFTEYNFGNSAVIKYYWGTLGCLLVLARENRDGFGESSFLRFKFS